MYWAILGTFKVHIKQLRQTSQSYDVISIFTLYVRVFAVAIPSVVCL